MKKILAIFLALIMLLSVALVSCTNDKAGTAGTTGDDDDGGLVAGNKNNKDDDDENEGAGAGDDTPITGTEEALATKVYPMCDLHIRKGTQNGTKVKVTQSTELTTTHVIYGDDSEPAWYKVTYNNETYYANALYVSKNVAETKFAAPAEAITLTVKDTATNGVNLRKYPSWDNSDSNTRITVSSTDTATNPISVLMVNEAGNWYKVSYKGSTYYLAITSATIPYLNGLPAGVGGEDLPG